MQIGKQYRGMNTVATFHSHADAWQHLLERVREHELCPKLAGIQKSNGPCYDLPAGTCRGACDAQETAGEYNVRVLEAIGSFSMDDRSFMLIGSGRRQDERSVLLVEGGTFAGFGFFQQDEQSWNPDEIREVVRPGQTSSEIEQYIQSYLHHPDQELVLLGSAGAP